MKAMKNKHLIKVLAVAASALLTAFLPFSCEFTPYEDPLATQSETEPLTIYDVASAKALLGSKKVWVSGYIVGCVSPFGETSAATNLAIADTPGTAVKDSCMSVELKIGELRDALNLQTNPANLGRRVYVCGDITQYYSIPGIKNISSWSLDNPPSSN